MAKVYGTFAIANLARPCPMEHSRARKNGRRRNDADHWGASMVRVAALILTFALAGCGESMTRDDVTDIAQDAAQAAVPDEAALTAKIAALESEIAVLKAEQARQASLLADDTRSDAKYMQLVNTALSRLEENERVFHAQINYLRARSGLGPIPEE